MSNVNRAALAAAIDDGARVLFGLPVRAKIDDDTVAILDLAAAARGWKNPWLLYRQSGKLVDQRTADARLIAIDGLVVSDTDLPAVSRALAAAPDDADRHDDLADAARREVGTIVMTVADQMVRARLLDHLDAWEAVVGDTIDDDDRHGRLASPIDSDVLCRLLVVQCPSTGRTYVHRVPLEMQTARDARLWVMQGIDPEVES
jgi:hypothetical protein